MLAVLSLAAISRCCSALAIAGLSFSAVARGIPSIGAIVTLALSCNVSMGEPRTGTSSANGCGSGWQPATSMAAAAAMRGECRRREPVMRAAACRDSWIAKESGARGVIRTPALLLVERDGGEPAPVCALTAQAGAPIAEETRLLDNRIVRSALHRSNLGPNEPMFDIAWQIEHEIPGAQCRRELVGASGDAGADPRVDAAPLPAERLHPYDSRLDNSAQSTAPAAMCHANNLADRIIEQDWGTVSREHSERNTGNTGHQSISLRRCIARPGPFYGDYRGAVDLTAGHQPIGREAQPIHRDPTVQCNAILSIAGAKPAIQGLKESLTDAALPG